MVLLFFIVRLSSFFSIQAMSYHIYFIAGDFDPSRAQAVPEASARPKAMTSTRDHQVVPAPVAAHTVHRPRPSAPARPRPSAPHTTTRSPTSRQHLPHWPLAHPRLHLYQPHQSVPPNLLHHHHRHHHPQHHQQQQQQQPQQPQPQPRWQIDQDNNSLQTSQQSGQNQDQQQHGADRHYLDDTGTQLQIFRLNLLCLDPQGYGTTTSSLEFGHRTQRFRRRIQHSRHQQDQLKLSPLKKQISERGFDSHKIQFTLWLLSRSSMWPAVWAPRN